MDVLPDWRETDDGWQCDDANLFHLLFAAGKQGLILPAFDVWLRGQPPSAERDELLAMRQAAKSAELNSVYQASIFEALKIRWMLATREQRLRPLASKGEKFRPGKPKGSRGPVSKAIKVYMRGHPSATAREVWIALESKPPKGHVFHDNPRLGKYIERADKPAMEWRRFRNLVSEHRPGTAKQLRRRPNIVTE